ncbi:hypothetical protein M3182_24450 [Mesobacillus maritimus]|uniref:hypothetical protein n=1 Tax=Mesobacillus maritimus TaxID=1643336 RepID=UPI00203E8DC9|nr:hypothetical protein [Mesobacillus maritimus]MCM3588785.1 hypothetical protein [Mesobacillus maritimus]MCM3671903.1 hypothetical protein [Mesobacillus maritimus]
MYTIVTGMNGVQYYGYPQATYGAWGLPLHPGRPQFYQLGGAQLNIQPYQGIPHFPQAFPYSALTVPVRKW